MEMRYIVLTIIKILISVPAVVLILPGVQSAALMGGHLDNLSETNPSNLTASYEYEFDMGDSQEIEKNTTYTDTKKPNATTPSPTKPTPKAEEEKSEEIPDPSPLVVPGYNLPERIFNKGKPFYMEKDPLTGNLDFNTKTLQISDEYDYIEEEPSKNIYDKANINRKDGSLHSHKPSDVNQLTPNFHDFLNLPVKYNPDKYVVPLISSSYANTKVQGNVNRYHNHKDDVTTYKPTKSPTYYTTNKYQITTRSTTTTTMVPLTTKSVTTTEKVPNLLYSGMNHPSFQLFDSPADKNQNTNDIYFTSTQKPTTTKRTMSLFETLFGSDYDEEAETEKPQKPPQLFMNLPTNKNKTPSTIAPSTSTIYSNNVLTGSKMEHEYEYEDYGNEFTATDNIAVENKPVKQTVLEYDKPTNNKNTEPVKITTTAAPKVTSTTTTTSKPIRVSTTAKVVPSAPPKPSTTVVPIEKTTKPQIIYGQTERNTPTTPKPASTTSKKVTSLPLGENHLNGQPIIVATQNLREKLNGEKVPTGFSYENKQVLLQTAPSTSNIHIGPDQDTVSFVMGHHQSVDGGQYVGSDFKVSPYDNNPFRPLYGAQTAPQSNKIVFDNNEKDGNLIVHDSKDTSVSYTISAGEFKTPQVQPVGSSVNIQPIKNTEASLTIGVPVNGVKVTGQVLDEKLELNNDKIEFPKGTGNKIKFPDEETKVSSQLLPPKVHQLNKDVLNLSSKPMFHQLPSDLTPPIEKEVIPIRRDRPRPPWDPRPGHFHSGRPEYARPPRPNLGPNTNDIYKRIDNLPNILPQFRPNMKHNNHHHYFNTQENKNYMRQPLLERPSNRPIAFFEKLQPPPPPKNLQNIRKVPLELRRPPNYNLDIRNNNQYPPIDALDMRNKNYPEDIRNTNYKVESIEQNLEGRPQYADDRIGNDNKQIDQFNLYSSPPKVIVANRRNGEDDPEVETLQMIQAKQSGDIKKEPVASFNANLNGKDSIEKPLYVVYPVNSPPVKMDVLDDNDNKESVVIGTRAELPLPPSKIKDVYDQNPLLSPKNRDESPILKPHPRPPTYPNKSDFPYAIERPDKDKLDLGNQKVVFGSNQWNSLEENIEPRIVTNSKIHASNQISVTLKTYTEKPIAVAYTPTESHQFTDKYSMPNYGSPVIPEIRPGLVENAEVGSNSHGSEFTVSAIMHTHPQADLATQNLEFINKNKQTEIKREDVNYTTHVPQLAQQEFQAPFQASLNVDNMSQGWTVVREKSKTSEEPDSVEATTIPIATTSEFDIENFKPQLIGGFKPIYNMPEDSPKEEQVKERQE